jgi:prepilin-type N-terminal cleavage/methylation domain-containing protein
MKNARKTRLCGGRGFSLVEMMIATLLFTIIAGVVFMLLGVSQQRYQMEKDYLNAFQQANVAMDQIARDVHSAGYPPLNSFTTATATAHPTEVANPFAWSPSYPTTPCTVGTCVSPGSYDLIVEADQGTGNGVQWIRYVLQNNTLMRGVANKAAGVDPVTATNAALVPYLENVMNNPTAAQMTALQKDYPAMFPGNAAIPIFTYTYVTGALSQPSNIQEVNITLIAQAERPDPRTNQLRVVTLTGQATRVNPNQ